MIAAVAGMVAGGLVVAAFTIAPPPPEPIALTIDSFPREVLGEVREDVGFRDAGSKAVLDRLDAEFDSQLIGHRFAYGGDGATLGYGNQRLTIVNGRLAPAVPVAGGGDDWEVPTAVSLQAGMTSCVADLPRASDDMDEQVFVDPATETIETMENDRPWTDCVLVDTDRNLSLRLSGVPPLDAENTTTAASLYRDELVRIHAGLIA